MNYLSMYANSKNALFVVAKIGKEIVGIISGLPLLESQEENKKLFEQLRIPVVRQLEFAAFCGHIIDFFRKLLFV